MIKAILFDLDGVLIETEKETFNFYKKFLKEKHDIILQDEDFKYKAGRKSKDFFNSVLTDEQREEVDTKALVKLKRELFNTETSKYIKKVEEGEALLKKIKEKNLLTALVSQNELRMINSVMDWLGYRNYFDVTLSIDDIKNLKPDPEIYLKAAEKLGVSPEECIVIEDSKDGVLSAKNAKMKCIGINHEYTPKGDLDSADIIINNLNEIDLETL